MYALIVPASTPFVLLATVLGLSWWEDHILPPATLVQVPAETPPTPTPTPTPPAPRAELPSADPLSAREVAWR